MLSGIDRYKRLRSEAGWLYIREILHRSESNFEDICQFTGWQSTLHLNFGDFAKEFDSVNRKELWRLLQYYDVPIEVVNVINKMYMLITGTKRVTCVLLDSNPPQTEHRSLLESVNVIFKFIYEYSPSWSLSCCISFIHLVQRSGNRKLASCRSRGRLVWKVVVNGKLEARRGWLN